MTREQSWVRRWVAACLVVAALTGCGIEAPHTRAATAGADQATPAPSSLADADARACAGVEAIIGHISVDASRWSPVRKPFDTTFSKRLSTQTRDLAAQASLADEMKIRSAVTSMASAFNGVVTAMRSKRRANVQHAIQQSQVAYRTLKQTCQLADR